LAWVSGIWPHLQVFPPPGPCCRHITAGYKDELYSYFFILCRIHSSLHNPVYGIEEFASSPTTPTAFTTPTTFTAHNSQPPIYEEVDVSITYCSEDEPEKLLHNPLYSDVTHTSAAPQVPPHFKPQNQRTGGPAAAHAVHTESGRSNMYSSDGSTKPMSKAYRNQGGQSKVTQGEHKTYPSSTEIPAQDYSKLDPSNQYACLEPHRGGKPTKMITSPPSVDDEYSHLEH